MGTTITTATNARYVVGHTAMTGGTKGPYSTYTKGLHTNGWLKTGRLVEGPQAPLSPGWGTISPIQTECSQAMAQWGFRQANSSHVTSLTMPGLDYFDGL